MNSIKSNGGVRIILATVTGCLLYATSAGIRTNYGIMISSIADNSGALYSSVSFVLAIGQLIYGITQPLFGILAIRKSYTFVLSLGASLMAAGLLGLSYCYSVGTLLVCLGILLPAGTGALSFGVIMGAISPLMDQKDAAAVSGIVTAGSGLGSTVLSPIIQRLIAVSGLRATLFVLCVPVFCILPLSRWISAHSKKTEAFPNKHTDQYPNQPLKAILVDAFRNRSYLLLITGFFTCGFHMAIIQTHLFSQFVSYGLSEKTAAYGFSIYGVAAMIGSVISGIIGSKFPMKYVLGSIYVARIGGVFLLLTLPKTTLAMYIVTVLLGLTASSTVPPTSGLVGKLFGTKNMAAFFGLVFVAHQIGGFFSSWLGGMCIQIAGSYTLIWGVSIILSIIAASASFLIGKDFPENRSK